MHSGCSRRSIQAAAGDAFRLQQEKHSGCSRRCIQAAAGDVAVMASVSKEAVEHGCASSALTMQQFSTLGSAFAAVTLGTVPGGHTKGCQPLFDTSVSAQVGKQLHNRETGTARHALLNTPCDTADMEGAKHTPI
jgi:hypothetical protein